MGAAEMITTKPAAPGGLTKFTAYQKFVVAMLAFLQFTIILDFMILSPLSAILIPAFRITTAQFGLVVSAYAFSAGASGFLAAGFADRFDRKRMLLFFYAGFLIATLLCAIAPTYEFLLGARILTGVFGGVIGSIVFAITTDLFPLEMRGRVMGIVQTAFASSQVLGIPLGLYLSNLWGWHAPFFLIVGIGLLAFVAIISKLRPINEHLRSPSRSNPLGHLFSTVTNRRYLQAFATMALLSTGGFMLMPFSSVFSVNNLGISLADLPMVYMLTGACSIVAGPLIGRWADRTGKFKVFLIGSIITLIMIQIFTRLGVTPLYAVIAVNVVMFVGISSRMISASALTSAIPAPADRGAFMAVNSSTQQISGGLAAYLAGLIVVQTTDGPLQRFDVLGNVVTAALIITVVMMYFIQRKLPHLAGSR
jgi:predicted MFS family arabinose efflux permease